MPFNESNATESGKKGGKRSAEVRWGAKDPDSVRNKNISIAVSRNELSMIDCKAGAEGVSRAELIVRAVREYQK